VAHPSLEHYLTLCDNRNGGLHSRGILMDSSFCNDPTEDGKMLSSIVIFNIALAFHLKASKETSHLNLAKAESLYQQSYRLMTATIFRSYQGGSTGNAVLDLFCMALLNNMAHLSLDLCEAIKSEAMLRRLIRYALSVQSTVYLNKELNRYMRQQTEVFLRNAVSVGMNRPTIASAA
jgi:hypothetical protein